MQRAQKSFGAKNVAVLLLSTDANDPRQGIAELNDRLLHARSLDWPNVLVPDGFDGLERQFNISGYGLMVVDHRGIVRGLNVRKTDLPQMLTLLHAEQLLDRRQTASAPVKSDEH